MIQPFFCIATSTRTQINNRPNFVVWPSNQSGTGTRGKKKNTKNSSITLWANVFIAYILSCLQLFPRFTITNARRVITFYFSSFFPLN